MNFKDEMRKLAELQEIDSLIFQLEREKDIVKPAWLKELKESFQAQKQASADVENQVKTWQLKKKDREVELASKEDNLRKAQGQLYQLKSNKEYQAKLTEISSFKADISVVEEELIRVLDEVESAKKKLEEKEAKLAEAEKEYQQKEKQINGEIKDIEAKLMNLQVKRKASSGEIDKEIVASYEKSLKIRNGLALAAVKNNNCGVCHMNLTHQKINEIKMYAGLVFCESCVRILYIPEDIY